MINFSFGRKKQEKPREHPDFEGNKKYAEKCLSLSGKDLKEVTVFLSGNVLFFNFHPNIKMKCGNYAIAISLNLPESEFKQICRDAYYTICDFAHKKIQATLYAE